MINKDPKKIEEVLTRGVDEVIDRDNLKKKLLSGKKLRIKLGIDPTSPNLHVGRAVPLLKLRDFQELGHQIVLIVGDFTGLIGDTSDKDSERPMLDEATVKKNLKDYEKQAGQILDIDKVEVRYNSEWLAKLGYKEIGEQADLFSLAEFIARENIALRLKAGKRVSLRELLYPLMQGYDSVAVKADVELGGTDQRFNLLAGREMQRHFNQPAQDIITNPLLEGLDGRKMSSSWGNTINLIDEPKEMFGKTMSLLDDYIIRYFECCTRVPMSEVRKYEAQLKSGQVNPRDLKAKLAWEIVKIYHGEKEANQAAEEFDKVFKNKEKPEEIKEVKVKSDNLVEVLVETKLASSKGDARRLILQGGVKIDDKVVKEVEFKVKKGTVVQKGKRYFIKIK